MYVRAFLYMLIEEPMHVLKKKSREKDPAFLCKRRANRLSCASFSCQETKFAGIKYVSSVLFHMYNVLKELKDRLGLVRAST